MHSEEFIYSPKVKEANVCGPELAGRNQTNLSVILEGRNDPSSSFLEGKENALRNRGLPEPHGCTLFFTAPRGTFYSSTTAKVASCL